MGISSGSNLLFAMTMPKPSNGRSVCLMAAILRFGAATASLSGYSTNQT